MSTYSLINKPEPSCTARHNSTELTLYKSFPKRFPTTTTCLLSPTSSRASRPSLSRSALPPCGRPQAFTHPLWISFPFSMEMQFSMLVCISSALCFASTPGQSSTTPSSSFRRPADRQESLQGFRHQDQRTSISVRSSWPLPSDATHVFD